MTAREKPCRAPRLPAPLADAVAGYCWARSTVGGSGGAVYRLHGKPGAPALYLKHGTGSVAADVVDEAARLDWLAAHLPVPEVVHVLDGGEAAWLLMTALSGRTAYEVLAADPAAGPAVVDALASFLRRLHAVPAAACPFDAGHTRRLEQARRRIDAGLVDTEDFDDERMGWTAGQVWQALHDLLPLATDDVVTHGDFSLDNILIAEGAVVGCIDVGRAGVADRYQDLAILWNCLGEFDAALQARLFEAYDAMADRRKIDFHLLLDELF